MSRQNLRNKELDKEQKIISSHSKKQKRKLGILNKTGSDTTARESDEGCHSFGKSKPENQLHLKTFNEDQ